MFAHRGLQNLGRQVQEVFGDAAHQGHRPFDQPCHLGQQAGIAHHLHARSKGEVGGALPDRSLTLRRIQHNEIPLQF